MTVDELLGWCVVANVTAETFHGEGGVEARSGLKHFAPGAKIWVLPPQWGDGGQDVFVVGAHRGTRGRLVRMVVPRVHLTNFRVRGIYQPAVRRELTAEWKERGTPRQWESREEAEEVAVSWALDATVQAGVRQPSRREDFFHCVRLVRAGESEYALREVMSPAVSLEIGVVFRDRQEVDAVAELRELLDTIEAGGVANWARNPLWPVVRAVAGKVVSLLSR